MMRTTRLLQLMFAWTIQHEMKGIMAFSLEMAARSTNAKKVSKPGQRATKQQVLPNTKMQPPMQKKPSSPSSIGEAIQHVQSVEELLDVASKLWLPTDPDLAPHLRTQLVHHEKRQRWSSQLLAKLGSMTSSRIGVSWEDDRLARLVLAAATPFGNDRPDREGRYVRNALVGLHALAGKTAAVMTTNVHPDICHGLRILMERAEGMAHEVSLPEAVEMRWAARGLLTRIIGPTKVLAVSEETNYAQQENADRQKKLVTTLPKLEDRVSLLPFDIVPIGVQWTDVFNAVDLEIASTLRDAIPFHFDTIVTRSGSSVTERRGTAWVTEEGIGALAYSGKLMPPSPIPNVVRNAMRAVEKSILEPSDPQPFFDCALCNHYPDGEAACNFHTDPEHGSVWERLTCVVAVGDERRFAFRPIPGTSTWSKWDDVKGKNAEETLPAVIHLFPGDVVKMFDTCNDDFHHAVYTAEDDNVGTTGRVSLVLKRAISRGSGKRGHGLQGEGRRSRRRVRDVGSFEANASPSNEASAKTGQSARNRRR